MNYNAPIKSLNLNNSSPCLQDLITNNPTASTFKEKLMQPFIILSCQAAIQQRISQGKSPSDSFDFLPEKHTRILNSPYDLPITFNIQHLAPSLPITQHEIINLQN
jgi:hypothetical protein